MRNILFIVFACVLATGVANAIPPSNPSTVTIDATAGFTDTRGGCATITASTTIDVFTFNSGVFLGGMTAADIQAARFVEIVNNDATAANTVLYAWLDSTNTVTAATFAPIYPRSSRQLQIQRSTRGLVTQPFPVGPPKVELYSTSAVNVCVIFYI